MSWRISLALSSTSSIRFNTSSTFREPEWIKVVWHFLIIHWERKKWFFSDRRNVRHIKRSRYSRHNIEHYWYHLILLHLRLLLPNHWWHDMKNLTIDERSKYVFYNPLRRLWLNTPIKCWDCSLRVHTFACRSPTAPLTQLEADILLHSIVRAFTK